MDVPAGGSSYFSVPSHGLDPHLFDAEHLKPGVRTWIINTLVAELTQNLSLHKADEWLYIWLAGSGITYQWSADRGNGDLDVLFGVVYKNFVQDNDKFEGIPEEALSAWVNEQLKAHLWPKTANENLNGQRYEVTFYWNAGVERDITVINPYAAYDVMADNWRVRPPTLPADPHTLYPASWYSAAEDDLKQFGNINQGYYQNGGSPRYAALARWLFDDIHSARRAAFQPGGKGYGDWNNFRWQSAKEHGLVTGLQDIIKDHEGSQPSMPSADSLVTRAMLGYSNWRQ